MGVLSSMTTGISGLSATGQSLNIISDNISNAGTYSFKASRAQFQDLVSKNLKGILGGNQIGRGVKLAGVMATFSQGSVNATERESDLAITGDGFFVLMGHDGQSFTRDGSFQFDAKGQLTDIDGRIVQGFQTNRDGQVTSKLGSIKIDEETIPARPTKTLKFNMNLDARSPIQTFNPELAEKTADLGTGVQMYDSVGNSHALTMYFSRASDNTWKWHLMGDGQEIVGGIKGKLAEVASGTLTFDKDGRLIKNQTDRSAISFTNGADPNQKVEFEFGEAGTEAGEGMKGTTQYGAKSSMYKYVQDGATAGQIIGMSIDDDGTLTGLYSNGTTRNLAQLALARFNSNEGLYKLGTNRFGEATKSGSPIVGKPGDGGRGRITNKALEFSNVDLAEEFVKMIQTQRNFQANAKTITTADEMLQDVISLKR